MARYSLGPPLRSGLPPYGRHHSTALMQKKIGNQNILLSNFPNLPLNPPYQSGLY